MTTIPQPPDHPEQTTPKPYRIWAAACPFNKSGAPVLGSFGSRVRNVVIIPMETWTKLCDEIPALAATKFEVGTYE